ncbi:MAG: hypothetical protein A2Z69_01835 [Bacteroidetes bacterium RBG_13_44_24]|nr:MAG: hypothetical protein A2Z69_01835 [Bacteroidetes bacterium RBG_13_44_24]
MRVEQQVLKGLLEHSPDALYLDIGCNDGQVTMARATEIGTKSVFGVDYLVDRIRAAKDKGLTVLEADADHWFPFKDEAFDVITATQLIEDLDEPDEFLRETKRILKPSGYAVLTTNNLAGLHYRVELLMGRQPRCMSPSEFTHGLAEDGTYCGHTSLFTYGHLKEVILMHGFRIEKSGTHTLYPLPVAASESITKIFPSLGAYSYYKVRK